MILKFKKSFVFIVLGVVVLFKSGLEVKIIFVFFFCVDDDLFVKNLGIIFFWGLVYSFWVVIYFKFWVVLILFFLFLYLLIVLFNLLLVFLVLGSEVRLLRFWMYLN